MKTNIKATAIELTPAITDYLDDKIAHLDRFAEVPEDDMAFVNVEIGKSTKHHKLGDFFMAEINLNLNGKMFRAVSSQDDLYAAIDIAKDDLVEQVKNYNKKKNTLLKRGGRKLKAIIKSFHLKKR